MTLLCLEYSPPPKKNCMLWNLMNELFLSTMCMVIVKPVNICTLLLWTILLRTNYTNQRKRLADCLYGIGGQSQNMLNRTVLQSPLDNFIKKIWVYFSKFIIPDLQSLVRIQIYRLLGWLKVYPCISLCILYHSTPKRSLVRQLQQP